jgi:hypothetical protein
MLARLRSGAMRLAGFLVLNLNPYLFEYFSLSRGYGLSVGLLMGALYFLLELADPRSPANAQPTRPLSRALLLSTAAVVANFALLNAYVSVVAVGVAILAARHRLPEPRLVNDGLAPPPRHLRAMAWLALVAAAFTLLVFSQDLGMTGRLYEPVVVRINGLNAQDLDAVKVFRINFRGQESLLSRHDDAWSLDGPAEVSGLRVEVPASGLRAMPVIETVVGRRPFLDDGRGETWGRRDTDAGRVFESGPTLSLAKSRMPAFRTVINWGGDTRYAGYLFLYSTIAALAWGVLALVLEGAGAILGRLRILSRDEWRVFTRSGLCLVALVGAPLYLLKRDAELYFGGDQGVVEDTVYSLINNSFHGRSYGPAQSAIAFGVFGGLVAIFLVVALALARRQKLRQTLPAAIVLGLMALVTACVQVQHWIFQTPYLVGRTALFYIPLAVLFIIFALDALAALGQAGQVVATSALGLFLTFAIYHFATTANVTYVWDWPRDAGSKAMIEDLGRLVARESPSTPHAVLEVYWPYWPVADVYAARNRSAAIDVVVAPAPRGSDFRYENDGDQPPGAAVVTRYPVSGTVLSRTAR